MLQDSSLHELSAVLRIVRSPGLRTLDIELFVEEVDSLEKSPKHGISESFPNTKQQFWYSAIALSSGVLRPGFAIDRSFWTWYTGVSDSGP